MTDLPLFMDELITNERPGLPDDFGPDSVVTIRQPVGRELRRLEGRVVSVARVWCVIDIPAWGRTERFRIDTQAVGSNYRRPLSFVTPAQGRWDQAHTQAYDFLRSQGMVPYYQSPWHARHLELARIVWRATS